MFIFIILIAIYHRFFALPSIVIQYMWIRNALQRAQILQDFPFAKSKHEALLHKIELLQSRITQAHRYWDRVSAEVDRCEVGERDMEVSYFLMRSTGNFAWVQQAHVLFLFQLYVCVFYLFHHSSLFTAWKADVDT